MRSLKQISQMTSKPGWKQMETSMEKEQRESESEHFDKGPICPMKQLVDIRDRLPNLDTDTVKDIANGQFYNRDAMLATMCVTDSIIYSIPGTDDSVELVERIRRYFRNLKQIGEESVEGYAMLSSLEDTKGMFILKAPRDQKKDSLLHEAFVGVYGTNQLRKLVPNFSYIYGAFKCAPPIIDPLTKKVASF